ncbi:MAG: DUF86 domain-containing protein [Fretibacterium sp.]
MLKTDQALLEDILEQCLWIRRYGELADAQSPGERSRIVTSGFNAGDIFDTLHFNAAVMNIQQIGELAKKLIPEFVLRTQDEIPWSDIRGMRNIIAHDYGKLSENTVREIELRDIPKLAAFCEKVLSAAKTQNDDIPEAEFARNQARGQKDLGRKNAAAPPTANDAAVTFSPVTSPREKSKKNQKGSG